MMQLVSGFGWIPEQDFMLAELRVPVRRKLDLSIFPMGVDNAHIDVALDRVLCAKASELIAAALAEQLSDYGLNVAENDQNVSSVFGEQHAKVTENILRKNTNESARDRTQLYQLALLKFILAQVDKTLCELRERLEATLDQDDGLSSNNTSAVRQQLTHLSRNQKIVRYKAVWRVLYTQKRIEHRGLRKLRKSLLGISWPAPEDLLFNPLLQLGGLSVESEFLKLYPYVFLDSDKFKRTNKIICSALADWLPDYANTPATGNVDVDLKSLPMRKDSGELPGYAEIERFLRNTLASVEFKNGELCWLDNPENLVNLLGGCGDEWPNPGAWQNKHWPSYQRNFIAKLASRLASAKLLDELLYSREMENLLVNVPSKLQPSVVFEYLTGKKSKKSMLNPQQFGNDIEQFVAICDEVRKRVKQYTAVQRQHHMVHALAGFARLRRDLKCAWTSYQGMERIRLLDDDVDRDLSSTNGLLRDFLADVGDDVTSNEAIGTVIIKADLRGSTALTSKMREKDLNPAVYFSENLFRPISHLLEAFSAVKVFVEGDAIIVALLQYEHPDPDDRIVARACGLAYRMLEVVKIKNRNNRKHKLPELELGIGITYIDEPPTYLFDGKRKITISPAINRADRLSSCAPSLHSKKLGAGDNGWGVEVVIPENCYGDAGVKETLLRYNVNGIELDLPAFRKLGTELTLKKIKSSSLQAGAVKRYFLGRFPDVSGRMSWLVIREAPVQYWDGEKRLKEPSSRQYFYEVVSDKKLVRKVRDKLA